VSLAGVRFELASRYRHLDRIAVRWARWDLGHVYLVDARTGAVLCRLVPLDRTANADGVRRVLEPLTPLPAAAPPALGIAPLLEKLLADYRATGLPGARHASQADPSGRHDGGAIPRRALLNAPWTVLTGSNTRRQSENPRPPWSRR
jgi:hypothetical protein